MANLVILSKIALVKLGNKEMLLTPLRYAADFRRSYDLALIVNAKSSEVILVVANASCVI